MLLSLALIALGLLISGGKCLLRGVSDSRRWLA